jgi:uncharacterized membrane protein HdeD (DUF308 family)
MAKTICKLLGVVLLLVGIIGFVKPGFLGTHLSMAHNLVHILSGIIALYFGFAASLSAARGFCLGICGFILGSAQPTTLTNMTDMAADTRLWKVIPGTLELGTADHAVHLLLGILFLVGALMTKTNYARAVD